VLSNERPRSSTTIAIVRRTWFGVMARADAAAAGVWPASPTAAAAGTYAKLEIV
jgi:hypothetical protein